MVNAQKLNKMKKDFIFIFIITLACVAVAGLLDIYHYFFYGDFFNKKAYFIAISTPLYLGIVILFIVQPLVKKYCKN